jgi:hypothetical protein
LDPNHKLHDFFQHELNEEMHAVLEERADKNEDGFGISRNIVHRLSADKVAEIRLHLPSKIVGKWLADEPPYKWRQRLYRPTKMTLAQEARHLAPKGATVAAWVDMYYKYALNDVADRTKATESHAVKQYDSTKNLAAILRMALEMIAMSSASINASTDMVAAPTAARTNAVREESDSESSSPGSPGSNSDSAELATQAVSSTSTVPQRRSVIAAELPLPLRQDAQVGVGPRLLKKMHTLDFMKSTTNINFVDIGECELN